LLSYLGMGPLFTLILLAFVTAAAFADSSKTELFMCTSKDGHKFDLLRKDMGNAHLVSHTYLKILGLNSGDKILTTYNPTQKAGFDVRFGYVGDTEETENRRHQMGGKFIEAEIREVQGKLVGTLLIIGDGPTAEVPGSKERESGRYSVSCEKAGVESTKGNQSNRPSLKKSTPRIQYAEVRRGLS
jgi:hypothetical protein